MSHKNTIIQSNYTIDIAGTIQDEYYSLVFKSDFNNSTIDQLPSGWTAQDNDGAEVKNRITGNNTTNSALLIRGERVVHGSVDNPPVAADKYRWVVLSQTFKHPVSVKFKAYEGRDSGGEYSATENPDSGEHLWLQYKVGTGAWQIAGSPLEAGVSPSGGTWDLVSVIIRNIDSGVSADNPLSLRWIYRTDAGEHSNETDLWAIDDIEVYELSTSKIPKRLTFFGAPNIRLQSTTQAYKTFLGKQKL